VSASEHEEGMALNGATVKRLDGDARERDEIALRGIENVRDATAIAVAGERHETFDAMPRGLQAHALLTVIEALGGAIARRGGRCRRRAHAVIMA
jgi:hypothetical protein